MNSSVTVLVGVVGFLLGRLGKVSHTMATTRGDLDTKIAALPDAVSTAVTTALQPILAPVIAAINAHPDDFTTEAASLDAIPGQVSAAVSAAVQTALAPPATTDAGSGN